MKPYFIGIDLTYKCNLKCLHCYNQSGDVRNNVELSDEELLKVISDVAKLHPQSICFCGGEPMLRKQVIYKGSKKIREIDNLTNINFVTNGELLNENDIDMISQSGITMVQVSLDGFTSSTHDWLRNKNGIHDKAVWVLSSLHEAGIVTAIAFAPNKKNFKELEDTINLCESLGVTSFRVQPLMVIGRTKKYLKNYILSKDEYKFVVQLLSTRKRENMIKGKMDITWGDPIEHLANLENNIKFPSLTISAFGEILLSPYIPLAFGNIKRASLQEYVDKGIFNMWVSDIYKIIAAKMTTPENLDYQKFFNLPEISFGIKNLDIFDYDNEKINKFINEIIKEGA